MKNPEPSVTFILPEAVRAMAARGGFITGDTQKQNGTSAASFLPTAGIALSAEDFCVFSTTTQRPVLFPAAPAFYFQLATSPGALGYQINDLMTYRGIGLHDDADLIFDWYRGVPATISTGEADGDGFLKNVPDIAQYRDHMLAISHYKLLFVLWYVNDKAYTPRDFWAVVENGRIGKNDAVDYCELAFTVQNSRVQNAEIVCHFRTSVHLWHLS